MDLEKPSLALNTKENIPDTWLQNPSAPEEGSSAELSETFLQLLNNISALYSVYSMYLPRFLEKEENVEQIQSQKSPC